MRLRNEEGPTSVGVVNDIIDLVQEGEPGVGDPGGIPVWKRVLDVACIFLALPVLIPVMGGIALLIFFVSPGSVLYLQERVGYRGRRFVCFKFRTMKSNANEDIHRKHLEDLMQSDRPMVKMDSKGDPRVIPLGSLLRVTGLDELPQLLNVLGGQMSLVGPRPCVPYEYENYLPEQKRRFETLPGLTGLWQVSGKNKTTFSEMIALDVRYVETKSLRKDLEIMFNTFPALLAQVREARARRRGRQAEIPAAANLPDSSSSTVQAPLGGRVAPVGRNETEAKLVEQK